MKTRKKKQPEPIYCTPDGDRFRRLAGDSNHPGAIDGMGVLCVRIRDGHRLYVKPERLTLAK